MKEQPTCVTKTIDSFIRVPWKFIQEIQKEEKDEYLFVTDCGNILRVKRNIIKDYPARVESWKDCLDFQWNPDDLVAVEEDGKLIIKKR